MNAIISPLTTADKPAMPTIAAARHLSEAELQEFAARLDAIGKRIMESRGPADERYIRRLVAGQQVHFRALTHQRLDVRLAVDINQVKFPGDKHRGGFFGGFGRAVIGLVFGNAFATG